MRIALTGATGFIGQHLTTTLRDRGDELAVLVRGHSHLPGVHVVQGDLDDHDALARLVEHAETVIHAAGLVRAVDNDDFDRVNVEGTQNVAQAVKQSGARMLLVSSLAARQAECSRYARSKRNSELSALVELPDSALTIVRPPAIYGPGDKVTMPIFQQIANGLMVMPAADGARFSMLYITDLVALLVRLLDGWAAATPIEPDDGRPGGYDWAAVREIGEQISGKRVRLLRLPRWSLGGLAKVADIAASIIGRPMLLSSDKLGELYHPDWVSAGLTDTDWAPKISFDAGAAEALRWYQDHNWMNTR